jgi:hypothetical protein
MGRRSPLKSAIAAAPVVRSYSGRATGETPRVESAPTAADEDEMDAGGPVEVLESIMELNIRIQICFRESEARRWESRYNVDGVMTAGIACVRDDHLFARVSRHSFGVSSPTGGVMSSVTTPPSAAPSSTPNIAPRTSPTLAELYEMTAVPDQRIVIRGVDWAFYEQLADSIPEGANIHVDYDGKDIEIMSLSPLHDGVKKRLGRFVELTAEELEIPCTGFGQATWKRPEVARGLESDECYYFATDKQDAAARAMA